MTALSEYQRLEAPGLWRENDKSQRRDVIVSMGEATLTIHAMQGQPLSHWSLAAVARSNPGKMPALLHPDGDPGETLELGAEAAEMVEAIDRVRAAVIRRRPRSGRMRLIVTMTILAALMALGVFWLPGALVRHAVAVVPPVQRATIGDALLDRLGDGTTCDEPAGLLALSHLSQRLLGKGRSDALVVLRGGVPVTAHLPGGWIVLNRALVEDVPEPDVTAGYVVAEALRAARTDPLADLLNWAGPAAAFRLLTTGGLRGEVLDGYAARLSEATPAPLPPERLLHGFANASISPRPYAYSVDPTGEQTLPLIEGARFGETAPPRPVLSDADWIRLEGICE